MADDQAQALDNGPSDNRYRLIVIYELEGADEYEAERKKDKLDTAAARVGAAGGFVDNFGWTNAR